MAGKNSAVDPRIFQDLQMKMDEDTQFRDELKGILQTLDRQDRHANSVLSRAHSIPVAQIRSVLEAVEEIIAEEIKTVGELAGVASKAPYFKYHGLWSRDVQNVIFVVLCCGWLGGQPSSAMAAEPGKLFTIEEVGYILKVPVNLKSEDAFHVTIEEYLQALISMIEELARLAINSVTLGDYQRPLLISRFVKEVHAGFQILNLKNDSLRRRSDSIKYNVKKIEDIVYDLSLRNLVSQE